ncbi:MAG: hypothetical protein ACFE0P_02815 [Oceanicaulis sp.]
MSHLCAAFALASALCGAAWAGPAPAAPSGTGEDGLMGRVLVGEDVDSYVRMESVRSAIVVDRRSGARATLDVTFSLNAPARATRRNIEQRRLWLRAAYSETLLIYAGRMYRWGDVPDLDRLSALLQAETDRLLGPGEAEVLLDTVLIHAG